jgi:hypothetical protein
MLILDRWRSYRAKRRARRLQDEVLSQGVEEIVDRVDPRLRGLSGYHAQLLPAVRTAVAAAHDIIGALPPPMVLSKTTWADTPMLRAMFASPERMRDMLERCPDLRDFLVGRSAQGADTVYAALGMRMQRRQVMQMAAHGDRLQQERQVNTISFDSFRLNSIAADEDSLRQRLRRRLLEEMAVRAANRIMGSRTRRDALMEEQAELKWRRKIYRMRCDGVGGFWHDTKQYCQHIEALEEKIEDNVAGLENLQLRAGNIEHFLATTVEVFENTAEIIRIENQTLHLDQMNREVAANTNTTALQLSQLHVGRRQPRIIQLVSFSPSDVSIDVGRALRRAARALGVS